MKETIKKLKDSRWRIARITYRTLKPFWLVKTFFTNADFRARVLTQWKFKSNYYQQSTFTQSNRYPLVFEACKKYLESIHNPKLLSFGCSTGEEVFTLGEYMPDAKIMGVDINEWCIRKCLEKNKNPNYVFYQRYSQSFTDAGTFDAIFCMAVFQRTENRVSNDHQSAEGFTFQQFEQEVSMLDSRLKPGGLLVIDHADFSFADTECYNCYQPLDFKGNKLLRNRPLFDKNNTRISEKQDSYRVFIKSLNCEAL